MFLGVSFFISNVILDISVLTKVYSEIIKLMTNIRGTLKPITDLAIVCTEKQFANLCDLDNKYCSKEYVYLLKTQIRGDLCGGIRSGELPKNSVAVVPISCSAAYLAFLLNSFPYQYILFDGKVNVKAKTKINRKIVSQLAIYKVDDSSDYAYGIAEMIREDVYDLYKKNMDDLSFQHLYNLISDLCNTLALELLAHPMFEQMGIYIIEHWKKMIEVYDKEGDVKILLNGLIDSDSILRNMIIKFHMSESVFNQYIKEHTDGLENK